MKISLNTLPKGRSEQIFDSVAELQHDESIEWEAKALTVTLSIDRQDQSTYIHGAVACTGTFICQSGMEAFEDTISGDFDLILTTNPRHMEENDSEEIVLIPAQQVEFDLYPYVHDTVLLSIPISHVCGPDCKAGQELKEKLKPESAPDERWNKLKDLFNE
ncbi:MAG: DUF177 domain-containing protein [Candidatus Marinimicrobia bacterium]|nr:DUF177 domain-containing protein [Candidatus Neomarinimicrobiota bacterium]MCF7850867.1 DUF177 domain-containing protein [Candidatus Neomarinimicrobiota bacterium]MCF7904382.1 DUF177 domain-containing protein [Candidatus Neomarinimicrobiota bacterium]